MKDAACPTDGGGGTQVNKVLGEADAVIRELEARLRCAQEQNDRLREGVSEGHGTPPLPEERSRVCATVGGHVWGTVGEGGGAYPAGGQTLRPPPSPSY